MIDLHNHILPGVDDGARSVEEACDMARALIGQGVTAVCCTPHTTVWTHIGSTAAVEARVAELEATLEQEGIGLRLLPAAEARLEPDLVRQVHEKRIPTLNHTSYLLLEFPYDYLPPHFEQVVFDLQIAGIKPVIAHPERIAPIASDPGILFALVHRGCLGQLTAMSLAGGFGPKLRELSELMLEHNLIHVVASDAHDAQPGGRMFALDEARSAAIRRLGADRGRALFEETPGRIVAGEAFQVAEPMEHKRKHFGFMRAFR